MVLALAPEQFHKISISLDTRLQTRPEERHCLELLERVING